MVRFRGNAYILAGKFHSLAPHLADVDVLAAKEKSWRQFAVRKVPAADQIMHIVAKQHHARYQATEPQVGPGFFSDHGFRTKLRVGQERA